MKASTRQGKTPFKRPARNDAFPGLPSQPKDRLRPAIATFAVGMLVGLSANLADGAASRASRSDPAGPLVSEPGRTATTPWKIPLRGWRHVIVRAIKEFQGDQIPAVAASVTFFGLLALFPALGAFVSLYGLFANVEDARRQIVSLSGLLPSGAVSVIGDQMTRLAAMDHGRLGLTLFISLAVSLWSSNAGVKSLITGLNIAYEERERRGFLQISLLSLSFTVGATIFSTLSVAAVVAAPQALRQIGLQGVAGASLLRWPLLLMIIIGLLSLLYRYGPCREHAQWRWITPGGIVGALGWMVMSGLFSWYVGHFGNYDKTYGSLGAIVGFMTWIWLSMIVVLFGAELNSELELQTTQDTTTGPPQPVGSRGASVADKSSPDKARRQHSHGRAATPQ